MKTINEEAIFWLIKEKEGLNETEKIELKQWLEINPSHQKSYNTNKLLRERFSKISETGKKCTRRCAFISCFF